MESMVSGGKTLGKKRAKALTHFDKKPTRRSEIPLMAADEDNPEGYWEWEEIKKLPKAPRILDIDYPVLAADPQPVLARIAEFPSAPPSRELPRNPLETRPRNGHPAPSVSQRTASTNHSRAFV